MKRRNFFKSLAALVGVAVVTPLELFGEKKDKIDKPIKIGKHLIFKNPMPQDIKKAIEEKGQWRHSQQGIDSSALDHVKEMERLQLEYHKNFMKLQHHILKDAPKGESFDWDKIQHYKELWNKSNPKS